MQFVRSGKPRIKSPGGRSALRWKISCTASPLVPPPASGNSRAPVCSFQANLVAAFEQSLVNMTSRLRHLAETAEEKVRGLAWGQAGHGHLPPPPTDGSDALNAHLAP